jgi:hypothetical protein
LTPRTAITAMVVKFLLQIQQIVMIFAAFSVAYHNLGRST